MVLRSLTRLGVWWPCLLWQVKVGVIKSLKPMLSLLLPNDDLREQVYDYIPLLLAEYQSSLEPFFITRVRVDTMSCAQEAAQIGGVS